MAYLDHAATTPLLPEALDALTDELGRVGNPSSLHTSGRRARRVVEESRESIAAVLGVSAGEVVFTSGGTEADNLAVKGFFWARNAEDPRRRRILASAMETYPCYAPKPLWSEQDPEDWWHAAEACLAQLPDGPVELVEPGEFELPGFDILGERERDTDIEEID